jgi:GT2 family glycosyltransferase/spore maturation protein CgeB
MAEASIDSTTTAMPQAGLKIEHSSYVRAWIEDDSADGPNPVSLLVNGALFWSGIPKRLEHPRFDATVARTPCGIWLVLPFPKTAPDIVEVKLVKGDVTLLEATVDLAERYIGFVDKVDFGSNGLLVEGWAQDRGRPLSSVELEVRAGNRAIASFAADKFRADLRDSGVGLGKHAFSKRVGHLAVWDVKEGNLRVVIAGTDISLAASEGVINSRRLTALSSGAAPASERTPKRIVLNDIPEGPPESIIAGICDGITEEEVFGWAIDLKDRECPVILDLLINDFVVATTETNRFRADIAAQFQCGGFAGFHFEIIPQMRLGRVLNVSVMARKTGQVLQYGTAILRPSFGKSLPAQERSPELVARAQPFSPLPTKPRETSETDPLLALIVLNQDGGGLLDRHFQSFAKHNAYRNVEYIVVDHGSTDDSRSVIEKWRSAGISINFVERGENYSFSASNNYAVNLTKANYLVFCNNDVFFKADTLHAIMDVLIRESVGIAGVKLLDEARTEEDYGLSSIQHLGVFYNSAKSDRVVHPVEARYLPILRHSLDVDFEVPAVTGAFLGIKRDDFLKAGRFCEDYYYGYEDIDLCLQIRLFLNKSIVLVASSEAIHSRGYSRKKTGLWGGPTMLRNSRLLSGRFGLLLRRILRTKVFTEHQYWTATKPIIAFAVSEASATTTLGDFYTAYEIAQELSKLVDAKIVFLEEKQNWYNLRDIDVLVAMTHNYDLSKVQNPKQNLVTVGWARNWFPEWSIKRNNAYDIIVASSEKGAATIGKSLGHPVEIIRIATSPERFYPDPSVAKTVDYVFTGNFWGHARDLIYLLEPEALPYTCEIYGAGWERVPSLAPYAKGFTRYDDLAGIYRRARVVLDDANSVTKDWGGVNSRVFDAISAGAMVITNSRQASEDAFDGKLPWFEDRDGLETLLHRYCGNEDERVAALPALQQIVRERHTYSSRAQHFFSTLKNALLRMFRIAIKVPCPSEEEAHLWGDYHFAQSLAKELRALGHSVRLDLLKDWYGINRMRDDVVIALRGLSEYIPTPDQINLCWLISHPTAVSLEELRKYDRVYVASHKYCGWLRQMGLINTQVLLQCVDTDMFGSNGPRPEKTFDVLFVGNSRNVLRPIVRDAFAINAPLSVIGSGWNELLPKKFILQQSVPHEDLPETYARARVVLNDHWDTMSEHGFISNRLFDCVATGAYVVSDYVDGISDLFGHLVKQYRSVDELKKLIDEGLRGSSVEDHAPQAVLSLCQANSFKARAATISDFITNSYDEICHQRLINSPIKVT